MTLNWPPEDRAALEALAAEQSMTKTQVIRQALRLYQMVHHRAKTGEQLAFVKDGKVVLLIVPSMLPLAADAMTIEEVMALADVYARAVHDGADHNCVASMDRLRAALTALVAQARDEEAEACVGLCCTDNVNGIRKRIRARIAGRQHG